MNSTKIKEVVFIGAGNLATNLSTALFNADCRIVQVFSRSIDSAQLLAKQVESTYTNSMVDINQNADIYFICTPDKAVQNIADKLPSLNGIVVHTSGSTDISVLSRFSNHGVFYPFQTFSKSRIIPFENIPICLSANNDDSYNKLNNLASLISKMVLPMNSETRSWLHLSGVIANNFTNHLLALSYQLSKEKGFSFELLKPLVLETIQKAFDGNPSEIQTGPAIRNDQATINLHIKKLMEYSPELADIYKELTLSIQSLSDKKR